jgi:DNA-binding MarR family transcriptional regulator
MSGWRSEAQATAWRTYIETSIRLQTRIEQDLETTSGLSLIDYHVLVRLNEAPGQRLRMGELADQLVFSPSRLTYQVGSMEKRGLVVRQRDPHDGRGTRAVLTAAGLKAFRDAAPHHLRAIRELWLDDLDPAELDCLAEIFGRLEQRLTAPGRASHLAHQIGTDPFRRSRGPSSGCSPSASARRTRGGSPT